MKTLVLTIAILLVAFITKAQEVSVIHRTGNDVVLAVNDEPDSVKIRVGKYNIDISDKDERTNIEIDKIDDFKSKWEYQEEAKEEIKRKKHRSHKKFDGHWDAIELGGNMFLDQDYSMYGSGTTDFMNLLPEKSLEFNLNFAEYDFGFCSYVGIVTGLGLNWNNYKFSDKITLEVDDNGMIQPRDLPEENFKKSKLTTVYLTAPLLFEIQIPGQSDRMFISGGVIGGLKIGDYTKYKIGNEKYKDKGDYKLNPLRWGYTARAGFGDFGLYATYYNVKLFQDGHGPALTPLTVGVTFTFD